MEGHHLIFGETIDYLSGRNVIDTPDERIRQEIARFLVEEKGYSKSEIDSGISLPVSVDGDTGEARIDFIIRIDGIARMAVFFGPGSLVSRQRAALAASRLYFPERVIPFTVVTSGKDAIIMATSTGKVTGEGLSAVFSRTDLLKMAENIKDKPFPAHRVEKEKRILFAVVILARRECENYTCRRC